MANKPDTWMPWYIGDYLADTMHLTRDQHGGYDLLLMAYWRGGGPLPDNDGHLAAVCKATPVEWRKLRPVLAGFFRIADGYWHQKRADAELAAAAKRQERAAAGGRGKADAKQPTSSPQAAPEQVLDGYSTAAPLPSPSPPLEAKASSGESAQARRARALPDDWEPSESLKAWALGNEPTVDIRQETAKFKDHWKASGEAKKDWDAAWRLWMRRAKEFSAGRSQPSKPPANGAAGPTGIHSESGEQFLQELAERNRAKQRGAVDA